MLKKLLYIGFYFTQGLIMSQSCPALLSPSQGASNVPVETVISWEEIPGIPGYNIALGTSPGGQDIISERNVGSATFFIPPTGLPSNTQIFVTITLFFFDSTPNIICQSIPFTTETVSTVPECTTLRNPMNDQTEVNFRTNISWEYAPRATDYILSLGTTLGGNELLGPQNVGNTLSFNPPSDLPLNTQIFATVIPTNSIGNATNCSVESFTVQDIAVNLGCTRLISPQSGDSNVPLTVPLQWEPIVGATSYIVNIGITPNGQEILRDIEVFNTVLPIFEFDPNSTIFVTITPKNALGEAINCTLENFSTAIGCGPFFDQTTGELVTLFPEIDLPETVLLCENGNPLVLSANTVAETYRWTETTFSGTEITLLSEDSIVEIDKEGFFKLELTNFADPNGNNIPCTTTRQFRVEVIPGPTVNAVETERDGDRLILTIDISGSGQYDFALNNIDGPYQNSNTFMDAPLGSNTIFVRDKSENGCVLVWEVEPDLISDGFPKFFTPNGDDRNDFWKFTPPPNAQDFEIMSISIFDRFGRLLFQFGPASVGWDGNSNGSPLPAADYWYNAVGIDNRQFRGHFTLKR